MTISSRTKTIKTAKGPGKSPSAGKTSGTRDAAKPTKMALSTSAAARKRSPKGTRALAAPGPAPAKVVTNTEGLDGAMRALAIALDKKALEPVLLDVRELCSFCNYQLVVSGRSDRQLDAIADGIASGLKAQGIGAIGKEAATSGQWALLDFGDFVVHVFVHAAREHFDLEGLWSDAPRVAIDVPAEARLSAAETY